MALERVPRAHIAIKKILPYELRIELWEGGEMTVACNSMNKAVES